MRLLHVILAVLSVLLMAGEAQADTLAGSYSGFVFATPADRQFSTREMFLA
jgi:hypothetical protein